MLPDTRDEVQNAALIGDFATPDFVARSITCRLALTSACLVADDPEILPEIGAEHRLCFDQTALDRAPVDVEEVLARLRQILSARPGAAGLVVHMGWVVGKLRGVTGVESWGGLADRLAKEVGLPVISVHDQDLVIE